MNHQFEKKLKFLFYGTKGGKNRVRIINLLRERPYNMNKIASKLGLNYRTVTHHVNVLVKEDMLSSIEKGKYGNIFMLSHDLRKRLHLFDKMIIGGPDAQPPPKEGLSPDFIQHMMDKMTEGVILMNSAGEVIFVNRPALLTFGLTGPAPSYEPIQRTLNGDDALRIQLNRVDNIDEHYTTISGADGTNTHVMMAVSRVTNARMEVIGRCYIIKESAEEKRDAKTPVVDKNDLFRAVIDERNVASGLQEKDAISFS